MICFLSCIRDASANFKSLQSADLSLGQDNMNWASSDNANAHPTKDGLYNPTSISACESKNRLFVADSQNNRVLVYESASPTNGTDPLYVIGQPDFVTNTANNGGVTFRSLSNPTGVTCDDQNDRLFIADSSNHRILIFNNISANSSNRPSASGVLGQTSGGTPSTNISQSNLFTPTSISVANNKIVVADSNNHRLMIWTQPITSFGQPANMVLGQPNFTTRIPGVSDKNLDSPYGVWTDGNKIIAVDRLNHRLLVWNTFPTTNNAAADVVIGQPDFTSNNINGTPGDIDHTPEANVFYFPAHIAAWTNGQGQRGFVVADQYNHRILVFDTLDPQNQQSASSYIPTTNNRTSGSGPGQFSGPSGVYVQSNGRIWVTDQWNHRLVSFPNIGTNEADREIGHKGFFSRAAANGGPFADGFRNPRGITTDGERLYVADHVNNRVLIFNDAKNISNGVDANLVLGQNNLNEGIFPELPSQNNLTFPTHMATDGNKLFVATQGRILWWNSVTAWKNNQPADGVLGQSNFTQNNSNSGTVVNGAKLNQPVSLVHDGKALYVADQSNHRVLIWTKPITTNGQPADLVLGHKSFDSFLANDGFSSPQDYAMSSPYGLSVDGKYLYVSEIGNTRTLLFELPIRAHGQAAKYALGQNDLVSNKRDPSSLSGNTVDFPYAVFSDGKRVNVGDLAYTTNQQTATQARVLIYNQLPTTMNPMADLVLGAADLNSKPPASTLPQYIGMASEVRGLSNKLFVVDYYWNRILRFSDDLSNYVKVQVEKLADQNAEQGSSVGVFKIKMKTTVGTVASWKTFRARVNVESASDIDGIQLYRDNGDNIFNPATDVPLTSLVNKVSENKYAELPLIPAETIFATEKVYWVAVAVSQTAKPEKTVSLEVMENNYFFDFGNDYVDLGLQVWKDSAKATVQDAPDVMLIEAIEDVSPAVIKTSTTSAMAKLTLKSNRDEVNLLSMFVTRTGDVGQQLSMLLFQDNGDGVFNPSTDINVSFPSPFINDKAQITLTSPISINTTSRNYFIAADVPANASMGTFGIALKENPNDNIVIQGAPQKDSVDSHLLPFSSRRGIITNHDDNILYVAGGDALPTSMAQGSRVALLRMVLHTNKELCFLNKVRLQRLGVGLDRDVVSAELWQDGGAPGFNALEDTLIASANLTGGESTLSFTPRRIDSTPVVLYGVFRLAVDAQSGNTVGMRLNNKEFIGLMDINTTIDDSRFPLESKVYEISNTIDKVTVTSLSIAPGTIFQGETKPFLQLSLNVDAHNASLRGITVHKHGTTPDTDIDSVRIYIDSNNDGALGPQDELVSSGVDRFVNERADVTLSKAQNIQPLPQTTRLLVALKMAAKAAIGLKIGLEVRETASLDILAPDIILSEGFPFSSTEGFVSEFPDVVNFSGLDIAPSGMQAGARNVVMAKLSMKVSLADAPLTALRADLLGSIADVEKLKLFWDANNDGLFGPQDQLVTDGVFSNGAFNFNNLDQLITTSNQNYFLVMDVSLDSLPGRNLGVQLPTNGYLTVTSPNSVNSEGFPFKTRLSQILEPPAFMNVVPNVLIAPSQATQTSKNIPMISFTAKMGRFTGIWRTLRIDRFGNSKDTDVEIIKLYEDRNSNNVVDFGTDTLVADATLDLGSALINFSGAPQVVQSDVPRTYLVALDIPGDAEPGAKIGMEIATDGSFALDEPDAATGIFPMTSKLVEVIGTVDTLSVSATILSPANVLQGSTNIPMTRLTLKADAHTIRWDELTLLKTGDLPDANIKEIKVFADNPGAGVVGELDSNDTDIAFGEPQFVGGIAHIKIDPQQMVFTDQRHFFVTFDVDLRAKPGLKFGCEIPTQTAFKLKTPDVVDATGFPIKTTLISVLDRRDKVSVSSSPVTHTTIDQNAKDVVLMKLRLNTDVDDSLLEKLRLDLYGNLDEQKITDVSLFADTNGSGEFETGIDARLGQSQFSGNVANLQLEPNGLILEAGSLFFITASVSLDSPLGATLGLGISNAGYMSISQPDELELTDVIRTPLFKIRDIKVPTTPQVFDDGDFVNTVLALNFDWQSKAVIGKIVEARYAVGTTPGGTDVRTWTSLPLPMGKFVADGLSMVNGKTYYVSVQAQSDFGLWSEMGISNGITVDIDKIPSPAGGMQVFLESSGYVLHWGTAETTRSGLAGYQIQEKTTTNPQWQVVDPDQTVSKMPALFPSFTTTEAESFVFINKKPGTYWYRVLAVNGVGTPGIASDAIRIDWQLNQLPSMIADASNYPNPFDSRTSTTKITYALQQSAESSIDIFDGFGNKVRHMQFSPGALGGLAGANEVEWDGSSDTGEKVSQGMYLLVLKANGEKKTWRIGVWH